MADHHDAQDPCRVCGGAGCEEGCGTCESSPSVAGPDAHRQCRECRGSGRTLRNTYAHALRRSGGDIVDGSAAAMQWGRAYRELHTAAIREWIRVVVPGGLVVVNMSNHVRAGVERRVVEWWTNELLVAGCTIIEIRRVPTRRQRNGANGHLRIDGEVLIVMRTPVR